YVGQGPGNTTSTIAQKMRNNLDGIWAVVTNEEGAGTGKQLWISEFGWNVEQVTVDEQAQFLTTSFDTLARFGNVGAGLWFALVDFNPGGHYGLFDTNGVPRASRQAFADAVNRLPPARNAMFVSDDVPAQMAPGESRVVRLGVKNLGGN